jgi:hypothetical protein
MFMVGLGDNSEYEFVKKYLCFGQANAWNELHYLLLIFIALCVF